MKRIVFSYCLVALLQVNFLQLPTVTAQNPNPPKPRIFDWEVVSTNDSDDATYEKVTNHVGFFGAYKNVQTCYLD